MSTTNNEIQIFKIYQINAILGDLLWKDILKPPYLAMPILKIRDKVFFASFKLQSDLFIDDLNCIEIKIDNTIQNHVVDLNEIFETNQSIFLDHALLVKNEKFNSINDIYKIVILSKLHKCIEIKDENIKLIHIAKKPIISTSFT
ncbi:hypothetical protein H9M94_01365 [Mycoplasma sp. Pen4]|uniref:hypothetical protein n=1 Tax=Mycoplasma sp. Pen4 TaxID=640330 RepID=UPI0016543DB6|nr:hypothetical protein [Mycoplasma sp. Pen4]QNM93906.1 hypothetical protein H9M94_01365 [Mycoplasma sp. Pen4]